VAGFDAVSFRWSLVPVATLYAGAALIVTASAFGTWAMVENEHFKQLVRSPKPTGSTAWSRQGHTVSSATQVTAGRFLAPWLGG